MYNCFFFVFFIYFYLFFTVLLQYVYNCMHKRAIKYLVSLYLDSGDLRLTLLCPALFGQSGVTVIILASGHYGSMELQWNFP